MLGVGGEVAGLAAADDGTAIGKQCCRMGSGQWEFVEVGILPSSDYLLPDTCPTCDAHSSMGRQSRVPLILQIREQRRDCSWRQSSDETCILAGPSRHDVYPSLDLRQVVNALWLPHG